MLFPTGMGVRAVIDCGSRERQVNTSVRGAHGGKRIKLKDGGGLSPWSLVSDSKSGNDITYMQAPFGDSDSAFTATFWREALHFWREQMMERQSRCVLIACDPGVRAWRAANGQTLSGIDGVGVLLCGTFAMWSGEKEIQWRVWVLLAEALGGQGDKDIEKWQKMRRGSETLVSRMRDKFSQRALRAAYPEQFGNPSVPRGLIIDAYISSLGLTEVDVIQTLGFTKVGRSLSRFC